MSGHELRFYAELGADGRAQLITQCECLQFTTALDNGHSVADLCRLAAQHTGTGQEAPDEPTAQHGQ